MKRLFVLLFLLICLPSWAASFTATTTGNWNASATWGKSGSPAVEGTDYPGPNDAFSIPSGKVVTVPAGTWPSSGGYVLNHASSEVQAGGRLDFSDNTLFYTTGDGVFTVDGTFNAGAVGAGITGRIVFTPATDGGAGFVANGTVTIVGLTKDHFVLLGANIGDWPSGDSAYAEGNLSGITLASVPSGWLSGDVIVAAPTGRTYSHWDVCNLSANVTTTTASVENWNGTAPTYTAGGAAAPSWRHQGEGTPTQARAEVLNLTRSFKIYSTDATKRTYINIGTTATAQMHYVEVYSVGYNATGKRGLEISTSTGSFNSTGISLHNSNLSGIFTNGGCTSGSIDITNGISFSTNGSAVYVVAASLTSGHQTFTSHISANVTAASTYGFNIGDVGSTFPSCRAVGNVSHGFYVSENAAAADGILDSTVSHSNGGVGYTLGAWFTSTTDIATPSAWRNKTCNYAGGVYGHRVWLTSPVTFGSGASDFFTAVANGFGNDFVVTTPSQVADSLAGASAYSVYTSAGGSMTVTGGSLNGTPAIRRPATVNNATWTNFAAPTFTAADTPDGPYLLSFRHNTAEDDHRLYFKYGSILSATSSAARHTQSGLGWLYQPSSAGAVGTWFRPCVPFYAFATKNKPITLYAWVKEIAGYNGAAAPRIVALGGYLQGVASDVIGSSWSGTPGTTWKKLTVTLSGANLPTESGLIPFVIEGQGTAAASWYVDDVCGRIDDAFGTNGWAVYKPTTTVTPY